MWRKQCYKEHVGEVKKVKGKPAGKNRGQWKRNWRKWGNDRVGRVVFNQNVFQLILQLGCCSLALAHTRDDIASSAMHVINIMMTDWHSCGTVSARWQLGSAHNVTWPAWHHLTSFNMAARKAHGQSTFSTPPTGCARKGKDSGCTAFTSSLPLSFNQGQRTKRAKHINLYTKHVRAAPILYVVALYVY